jgi:hypothetical protein
MNLIKKINFDEDGIGNINYFCNGQQISLEQYDAIESDLFENDMDNEFEGNCEECCGSCCGEDELEDIIHNTVVDICNTGGCPYCIEDRIRTFMSDVLNYIDEE